MNTPEPVHPAANEAGMKHLHAKLSRLELEHAVAVGNLAWKNATIAERDAQIADLERQLADAKKQAKHLAAADRRQHPR